MRRKLEQQSFPRLQMTLIAALTGGFGLLSSFLLLHQGMDSMVLRYPLAVACAYAMFLFLIWLWLRVNASDYFDAPDLSGSTPSVGGNGGVPMRSGGGGDFGGGGASGSFDDASPLVVDTPSPLSSLGESFGSVADADEVAVPVVAVAMAAALAVGLAFASLYVIYIAPMLLAEVLVDGALSFALYRYIRGHDPEHWLATAIRRTIVPFITTGVFMAIVGAAMSAYAPGARSIGEVLHQIAGTT